jgi:hypothetical protein
MYAIPVTIEHGVLKLPPNLEIPADARSAFLVFADDIHPNDDLDTLEFKLAALRDNPALAFLDQEEDLYSVKDVRPENRNPFFGVQ